MSPPGSGSKYSVARAPRAFAADAKGNVAMFFAISMVPLLAIVGAGVDYAVGLRAKSELQIAMDAAVIAGATALSQGSTNAQVQTVVANFVAAKYRSPDGSAPTVTSSVDVTGKVTGAARTAINTNFMRYFGTTTINVAVNAEAMFGTGSSAEVVIALDTTGSMAGAKLAAAQAAASQLVDTLYSAPGASSKVKVGFVPFNYYVNIGSANKNASWMSGAADYTDTWPAGCDTSPSYPGPYVYGAPVTATGYNDGIPYTYTYTPVISYSPPGPPACWSAGSYTHTWGGAAGSRNYPKDLQAAVSASDPVPAIFDVWDLPAPLARLSSDPNAIKTQIAAMTATGETYIPSGLLWGWRILSPDLPFADGAPYASTTKKILILMTDGANTVSPTYPAHNGNNSADADNILKQTCSNMRAANISVYTIAFQVTDPTIQGILLDCAGLAANYFNATTIADMQTAFSKIGAQLTAIRVSR